MSRVFRHGEFLSKPNFILIYARRPGWSRPTTTGVPHPKHSGDRTAPSCWKRIPIRQDDDRPQDRTTRRSSPASPPQSRAHPSEKGAHLPSRASGPGGATALRRSSGKDSLARRAPDARGTGGSDRIAWTPETTAPPRADGATQPKAPPPRHRTPEEPRPSCGIGAVLWTFISRLPASPRMIRVVKGASRLRFARRACPHFPGILGSQSPSLDIQATKRGKHPATTGRSRPVNRGPNGRRPIREEFRTATHSASVGRVIRFPRAARLPANPQSPPG